MEAVAWAREELDRLTAQLNEESLPTSSAAHGGAAHGGAVVAQLTAVHELLATKHSSRMAFPEDSLRTGQPHSLFPNVSWCACTGGAWDRDAMTHRDAMTIEVMGSRRAASVITASLTRSTSEIQTDT
eukprot:COSAG01_NODE_6205_length_3796_cov_4.360022_3_plen_128_part_00